NVGIGTTNPSYSLDISAATAKARVSSSTGTNAAFFEASNRGGWFDIGRERSTGGALLTGDTAYAAVLAAQGTYPMQFGVNDSVVMTLLNGGNVGIGTTVPATVLDINGAMSVRGMAAPTVSPAGQGRIYFDSTANKFKISENGGAYSDIGSGGGSPSNTAYSAHMARVSTTQSIPSGTVTTIDFDTETYDVGGFASTATDRFTIAYAGKYLVQTSWTAYPVASTQCAWLYIHVNGTQRRTIYDCMANNVYGSRQIQSSEIFDLAAGDYIDMRVYQDTGAALNTQTAANGGPQMSVTLMSAGAGDNNNQWTLASGKLYYNGGDVGIGTTAPASALDVAGNMSMRGGVFNSFDPVTPANYLARLTHGGTGNGSFQLYNAGSLNVVLASSGNSYLNGGNVGIGTTAPAQDLHISQAADSVIRLERTSSGSAAEIATAHDSEGFVIRTRTNHGIRFATNTTSGDWTDSTRMFIAAGGNVGVGTTSPNAKMHVNCDTTTVNCLYLNSTGGGGTLALFQTAGVTAGSISIGGGPSIAYNTTSDARLKENIRDSLAGLTDLKRIDVRDYNYIADSSKTSQQGFIAQQLYTIYPEAVTVGGKDPHSQPWSVDYGRLTPLIVKSVQELNNKCEMSQEQLASIQHIVARHERDIASVKTENEKLKRENVAQAKELEAIKARLEKIEKALNSK
ncbi:MAG: tail fiber domain-containing protein, partial [Bdellovibrionales bacterium]